MCFSEDFKLENVDLKIFKDSWKITERKLGGVLIVLKSGHDPDSVLRHPRIPEVKVSDVVCNDHS